MHDSRVFEEFLDETNTSADVWADRAYRSIERETELKQDGCRSHIHGKGQEDKPRTFRPGRLESRACQPPVPGDVMTRANARREDELGRDTAAGELGRLAILRLRIDGGAVPHISNQIQFHEA